MNNAITVDSDEYTQLLIRWGELYLFSNERKHTPDEAAEMRRISERMEVAEIAQWRAGRGAVAIGQGRVMA